MDSETVENLRSSLKELLLAQDVSADVVRQCKMDWGTRPFGTTWIADIT
jgi:hypothetical protein